MNKRRKKLVRRLKREFRLSLLHEASYEERFSILLTPFSVLLIIVGIIVLVGGATYALTALTPLREYVVPGYIDDQHRKDAFAARMAADSLKQELSKHEQYISNLQVVLAGGVPGDSTALNMDAGAADAELNFDVSDADSALRARVEDEDKFMLQVIPQEEDGAETTTQGFLFRPVDGSVSAGYDAEIDHYGIDLVAPANSVIKAVLSGTVLLASYTSDGGNVIAIQHEGGMISVYKHNSALYKKAGDRVRAGESIAVIGNTGDHSDGPHLHFELWKKGVPVDPLDYLMFE